MSNRLYYEDAYLTKFDATVIERLSHNGQPAVILDQSCFYPTSGGQPCDTGRLHSPNNLSPIDVLDVVIRPSDQAVVHVLATPCDVDTVRGEIDWQRRFDHMQQHSGQHILSQAFIQVADAHTVGFHLNDNNLTIDIDAATLDAEQIAQTERLANTQIMGNIPIQVEFVTRAQAEARKVRKIPPKAGDALRLVGIGDFDLTACGGTHVSHTGEIGLLKIIKLERRKKQLRVTFACGWRALDDYGTKNAVLNATAGQLTVGFWEVSEAVSRLNDELKAAKKQLKKQQAALLDTEVATLRKGGRKLGAVTLIMHAFDELEPGSLRQVANRLVAQPDTVALLGCRAAKSHLILSRSDNVALEMNTFIKPTLAQLDSQAGGGTPAAAQGTAPAASTEQIASALQWAGAQIEAKLAK